MTRCPHCLCPFTDAELLSLRQSYASRQRKTKSGGKNGGRRPVAQPNQREEAQSPVRETQQEVGRILIPIEDL